MSILARTLINTIEGLVKKNYQLLEINSVSFVFNYLADSVRMEYVGINQTGNIINGGTQDAKIDRADAKFKMLGVIENSIEKQIKAKPDLSKIKLNSEIGGFECELFFERDGKKCREVHLIKI